MRATVARDQTELDLRQTHSAMYRRDTEGTGHGQLQPAAKGIAMQYGDRRNRQAGQLVEDTLTQLCALALCHQAAVHQFLDVGAGAERLRPGPSHNERASAGGCHLIERVRQCFDHRELQGVAGFGPVEREDRVRAVKLDIDGHGHAPAVALAL
ncbi:hypothetical protein D3C72_1702770 [compost metagenome]